jgi:hypothetical protein
MVPILGGREARFLQGMRRDAVLADGRRETVGVGELVAAELLGKVGERAGLLERFRFSRYAQGKLHPVSNSPFP